MKPRFPSGGGSTALAQLGIMARMSSCIKGMASSAASVLITLWGCQSQSPVLYPSAIVANAATGEFQIELIASPPRSLKTVPVYTNRADQRISGLSIGGSGPLYDRVVAKKTGEDTAGSRMVFVPRGVAYNSHTAQWQLCMGMERLTRQAVLNTDRVTIQIRVPVFPTGGCRESSEFFISGRPDIE